ncbi:MAG: folate-binding protein YgfZ [Neisseriaceae bacterium]|nr:folate-binding protein YgfZ [Neisseriaceae bacterium]
MIESLLPTLGVLRFSGKDARQFLHNQLSNDIQNLQQNQACYASYNTPQGRVTATMIVVPQNDDLLMIVAGDLLETLQKRLTMFVLRSQVKIEMADHLGVAFRLPETVSPFVLPDTPLITHFAVETEGSGCLKLLLPHGGALLLGEKSALPPFDENAVQQWQTFEIQSGFAWITAATSNLFVAQMLNLHRLGGIHFKKGCYVGQEVIARSQYIGQVKRGLAVYQSPNPLSAGDEILNNENNVVGNMVSVVGNLNLCVIKHAAIEQILHIGDTKLSFVKSFIS